LSNASSSRDCGTTLARHDPCPFSQPLHKQDRRIDTWVNDAGVAIYGRLEEVSDAENRRLFDMNFWGVVYGSLVALPHLRRTAARSSTSAAR